MRITDFERLAQGVFLSLVTSDDKLSRLVADTFARPVCEKLTNNQIRQAEEEALQRYKNFIDTTHVEADDVVEVLQHMTGQFREHSGETTTGPHSATH